VPTPRLFPTSSPPLDFLKKKKGELQEKGLVLEKLGDIKMILFELEAGLKYWNDALLLWEQLHEKEKVSRLHRKIANVLWGEMDDAEKAMDHYNKALKILETAPESVELASLHVDMATQISIKCPGDMAEALSWAQKGLELAKKLNAYEVIARSYASLGGILVWTGDKKKGLECLERALKVALDNGYIETALLAYIYLATGLPAEEYERHLECWEKGFELAKRVGHIGGISWFSAVLARVCIEMGDVNKALLLAEESVGLSRKSGSLIHLNLSLDSLGFAYQILGEWNKSEQYYKEALSISQRLDDYESIERGYGWIGWFHLDKGEYIKAREFFEKMYEVCEKAGVKYGQMHASRWLIWTYIELGEIGKAKNLLDSLYKFALETKDRDYIAKADALRAMLFRAQKKWKESIEHFEKSLQEHEAINARRWNIYLFAKMVLREYARVYLERDQEGDKEKAHHLLNQALEIFQKMGAKKEIEKVKSRLIYIKTGREMVEPELVAKVPEIVPPSHIKTGYKELDDLLFGGIPRNYSVILTSPSCDERDLLIKRFLKTGVKEGEITFHIIAKASGMESLVKDFQSNFYLFICNPEADVIIKSLPNVFKLKGVENLNDINIALTSAFRKLDKIPKGTRRVCIEIFSDVLLQHRTVQTRRWLNALIPKLKSKGFTTLAVIDPRIHSPQEFHAIVNLFEGEINIYEKETKKGLQKFLKIMKMYNQKYLDRELPLKKEKLQK
jgi:tetratricopeptide (TPR) repeat protein/KaiC/GvpD/RAD55 family RecA-like ATPase